MEPDPTRTAPQVRQVSIRYHTVPYPLYVPYTALKIVRYVTALRAKYYAKYS